MRRYVRLPLVAAGTFTVIALTMMTADMASVHSHHQEHGGSLWDVYEKSLRDAKYVDLTHTITPSIPVWPGFGPSTFMPTKSPSTGLPYTYARDGFEATS